LSEHLHPVTAILFPSFQTEKWMAKPNFKFQKRQKELEKKKKNDEKAQRRLDKKSSQPADQSDAAPAVEEDRSA
jgi:hypothetical protein